MKKKTRNRIGIAAAVLVVAVAGYQVFTIQKEYAEADSEYEDIVGSVYIADDDYVPEKDTDTTTEDTEAATEAEESPYFGDGTFPRLVIDHKALKRVNELYQGWLYVPCLEISYPVVQYTDNEYYLHHTFENTENNSGCIFIDSGNKKGLNNYNTIIYGHNMKNGSMFGSMRKILTNSSIIKDDPYIYFYSEEGVRAYRVYSYHRTQPESPDFVYQVTQMMYWQYIDKALADRLEDMEVSVDKSRNSILLSTCNGAGQSKQRLVIHAFNVGFYEY